MGIFLGFLSVILFYYLYGERKNKKQKEGGIQTNEPNKHLYDETLAQMDEERKQENASTLMENNKGTRDLFLETLTKIGCQYEFAEEEGDNRIFFAYQGEHFFVNATNEGWYIHIYDTHWGHIELYDIEEFARLKKAINGSNLNNSVMTIYTIDEAGSSVDVHCKSTILFIPQIPRIEDYLRLELNEFFRAHQYVGNEMARLRESEKSNA